MGRQFRKSKFFILLVLLASALLSGSGGEGMRRREGMRQEEAGQQEREAYGTDLPDGELGDPETITTVAVHVGGREAEARTASGSGVVWEIGEDALWIVTAGHVTDGADGESRVFVEFGEGTVSECTQYGVAEDADLAFLMLSRRDIPDKLMGRLVMSGTDKESYDALGSGDVVRAEGFGEGNLALCEGVLTEPWIYVEDFAQYMMVAECGISHGMSGGGLYDGEGHLIGIVCGGSAEGELAAVPLHVVQAAFHTYANNRTVPRRS